MAYRFSNYLRMNCTSSSKKNIFLNRTHNPNNSIFRNVTFYQANPKGRKFVEDELTTKDLIPLAKQGWKMLPGEFKLWKEEWQEKMAMDPKWYQPGDTEIIWKFNEPSIFSKWLTAQDKDHGAGNSECSFTMTKNRTAMFTGYTDTTLIKDGKSTRTGYCAIKSVDFSKSFQRIDPKDWRMFTHLAMRIRGDGRSYTVNIKGHQTFDIFWSDLWSSVLYTRGGPYWQDVKIPFSRFYLNHKGRVQDKQTPFEPGQVLSLGITLSDGNTGPFQLEIDQIGLHMKGTHNELTAFEMYRCGDHVV